MLAQDVSANPPIVAKPYRTKSARMAYLPDSTSTNQEENVFIDGVPMPEFPGGTKALVEYMVKNTRYPKELLPWDTIDVGVRKDFLLREKHRAYEAKVTPDCRSGCSGCGADRLLQEVKCDA